MIRQTLAILREIARRWLSFVRYVLGLLAMLGVGLILVITGLIVDMRQSGADWVDE